VVRRCNCDQPCHSPATAEARLLNRHIPYLTRIVLISVLIGASLGALIPNRPPLIDRAEVFVVVALLWMFLSLLVHGVCRILGGREDAGLTMLLMMQALAFAYVASNFLTLLTFQIGKYYVPRLTVVGTRYRSSTNWRLSST
jgi:hypothetical protein